MITAIDRKPAEGMTFEPFYRCTFCDWLGFLADAGRDGSVAQQGELCPECFSHIEANDEA